MSDGRRHLRDGPRGPASANGAGPGGDECGVRCGAPPSYLLLKGACDRLVATGALLLTWPVLLWIAWRVRRDSPGPALFRQVRAGRGGRPFELLKYRTMRLDADPYGDSPQSAADPRITPLGRWLREKSLDELPQLINVLRGEMSLVGPRPLYVQQITEWDVRQRCRLLVKPGLTGFAQVLGRGSLTLEDKLELDVQYVQRLSLRTDLELVWKTLRGLWRGGDIYELRYSHTRARRTART